MNHGYRIIALTLLLIMSAATQAIDNKDTCGIEVIDHQQRQLLGFLLLNNENQRPLQFNLTRTHSDETKTSETSQQAILGNRLELIRSSNKNGSDLLINLYIDDKNPRVVAVIALHRDDRENGGFSSFDRLSIQWPEITPRPESATSHIVWPEFFIIQTSSPAKSDRHFRPGPPQTMRYRYQAPCYQQAFITEGLQ